MGQKTGFKASPFNFVIAKFLAVSVMNFCVFKLLRNVLSRELRANFPGFWKAFAGEWDKIPFPILHKKRSTVMEITV